MTIYEAIKHQRDIAEEYKYQLVLNEIGLPMYELGDREISRIEKYVEEYTQVAEWLEELKALKEEKAYWDMQNHKAYNQGRADAIDECIKILTDDCKCEFVELNCFECMAVKIEQLKEQNNG